MLSPGIYVSSLVGVKTEKNIHRDSFVEYIYIYTICNWRGTLILALGFLSLVLSFSLGGVGGGE